MMVSIIVPVFNVKQYISECVNGVLKQSYQDWELLLIDDGSYDGSSEECDQLAELDPRIVVVHKKNTGVSDTRNYGLDLARGDYAIFLDADDYWYDITALELLIDAAQKYDLDIVRGEYKAVDQNGNDLFERPFTKSKKELAFKTLTSGVFYTQIICGENFLVLSLFKKEVIGNLRFNVCRSFLEDMEFYAHLLLRPLRCMFVPLRFYAYRKLQSSASHTPSVKNLADSFSMCDVFKECSTKANDDELIKAYEYNSIMMYCWTLDTVTIDSYFIKRKEIIGNLGLVRLQQKVCKWSNDSKEKYPVITQVSPIIGVWLLKVKHTMGLLVRKLKSIFEQ